MTLRRALCAPVVIWAAMLGVFAAPASASQSERPAVRSQERILVQNLLTEINSARAKHSLRPIRICPSLSKAADRHVVDMGRQGFFSHDSADGSDFGGRIARYYPAAGFRYWSVGENLLWSTKNLVARDALRIWMNSTNHRANLLRRGWRQIGISGRWFAEAPGVFGNRGVWIVATDFGTRY